MIIIIFNFKLAQFYLLKGVIRWLFRSPTTLVLWIMIQPYPVPMYSYYVSRTN